MTTYEKAIEAELEIDNHASDLYIKDTTAARVIVGGHEFASTVTRFRSQIDGCIWFDVPFAFDPWWNERKK